MADQSRTFARTWRVLAVSRLRAQAGGILAVVLLASGWAVWLFVGKVDIYASSEHARFESTLLPEPVQSAVDGTVVECNLALGSRVHKDDVLVRLDSRILELQRRETQANLDADLADVDLLEKQVIAEREARDAVADLVKESVRSGRAKVSVSQTTDRFKAQETDVLEKLSEKELASKLDAMRAEEDRETNHAQVVAVAAAAAQETTTHRATLRDRDVEVASLERTLTAAQAKAEVLRAGIETLDYQIALRAVRAMSTGTLADILPCAAGMTLDRNLRIATLLPDSDVRIVSFFKPEDAVGRVVVGQPATVRVDNFPWTQFGVVGARVDRVGTEPRDGLVRIELTVANPNPAIPSVHGLTGSAEIRVERISPFHLLLRTAGQELGRSTPAGRPGHTD